MKLYDTIAAIATPIGIGGITIIRISGENAVEIASSLAKPKSGIALSEAESRKLYLCDIYDNGRPLDEALVTVMRAPASYTGEDVVEINCHGGYIAARSVLDAALTHGARLAEAGEFTRRAFINGKTDLTRVEATADLIDANSRLGAQNAANALAGRLAEKISALRETLLDLASEISAAADYPEEIEEIDRKSFEARLIEVKDSISGLISGFETGKILRDGICTVIVGRPNVGKSSVLNALAGVERAIVTDIPGTTRDVIEENINLGGIALRLLDTAGIHDSSDEVEKIGIQKSLENISSADLCIFVADSSEEICAEDLNIIKELRGKNTIVLLNKADKAEPDVLKYADELGVKPSDVIVTAAPKDAPPRGIDKLCEEIKKRFLSGEISSEDVFITSEHQKMSLSAAMSSIDNMLSCINSGAPDDLLFVDLEDAVTALGEITGETVQEEIIDRVFERFCVGK